jgi:hypothetical protein
MGEHIPIERAWVLIQGINDLSASEAEHLKTCSDCTEFLEGFVSVGRYVGYSVHFPSENSPIESDRDRAA